MKNFNSFYENLKSFIIDEYVLIGLRLISIPPEGKILTIVKYKLHKNNYKKKKFFGHNLRKKHSQTILSLEKPILLKSYVLPVSTAIDAGKLEANSSIIVSKQLFCWAWKLYL